MKVFEIFAKYPKISMFIVGCLFGGTFSLLPHPERIITKTEVQEKVVYKEVYSKSSESQEKKNKTEDRDIITKIIEHADGTKETIITDKTKIGESSDSKVSQNETREVSQESSKHTKTETVTSFRRDNQLGVAIFKDLDLKEEYQASYSRRLFDRIWAQVLIKKPVDGPIGVGVGGSVEF